MTIDQAYDEAPSIKVDEGPGIPVGAVLMEGKSVVGAQLGIGYLPVDIDTGRPLAGVVSCNIEQGVDCITVLNIRLHCQLLAVDERIIKRLEKGDG